MSRKTAQLSFNAQFQQWLELRFCFKAIGSYLKESFSSIMMNMNMQMLKELNPHPAIERVRDIAKRYWKM